jgi:hypothetical protein
MRSSLDEMFDLKMHIKSTTTMVASTAALAACDVFGRPSPSAPPWSRTSPQLASPCSIDVFLRAEHLNDINLVLEVGAIASNSGNHLRLRK